MKLQELGYVTTVRKTRGDDVEGACGQLSGIVNNRIARAGSQEKQRCGVILNSLINRERSEVQVAWRDNKVNLGGGSPVVVQSMTNTDTADVIKTSVQIKDLSDAGSELVRITVNSKEAARAVPDIRNQLDKMNCKTPLIGDFHFNGHKLLRDFPACAESFRNLELILGMWVGEKKDTHFAEMIEIAMRLGKPIRIGVNWGSSGSRIISETYG